MALQAAKRSDMSSAILQQGRFADVQESRFQFAKRSEMGSAVPEGGWFPAAQESRI